MTAYRNFIDGRQVAAASGATLDVTEPATGQVWATIPRSGAADIDAAVRAAESAFGTWSSLDAKARAGHLRAIAEVTDLIIGFGKVPIAGEPPDV